MAAGVPPTTTMNLVSVPPGLKLPLVSLTSSGRSATL